MSEATCRFSMSVKEMRKEIECELCQKKNPSKRCSRCTMSHYCSAECQKLDWKAHKPLCIPIEVSRKTFIDGAKDEENRSRIRLSNISSWTPALEKAEIYSKVGHLTEKTYLHHLKTKEDTDDPVNNLMDEDQEKYCKLALEQLNIASNSDPTNVICLLEKGQILRFVMPHEAINALQEALRRDQEGVKMTVKILKDSEELRKFRTRMNNTLTAAEIEDQNHPMVREWTTRNEAIEQLKIVTKRDAVQINNGPYRLYPTKINLAEAYESAGEFEKAVEIYQNLIHESNEFYYRGFGSLDGHNHRTMKRGGSRCFFALKEFENAKKLAQMALDINRHYCGAHILLAQAQWALNEKKEAIRTMCRAVIYEAPWDEAIQELNRTYLQEFIDAMGEKNPTDVDVATAEESKHNEPHVNT